MSTSTSNNGHDAGGLPTWADQMRALEPVADHLLATWKPDGASGPDGVIVPDNIFTKAPTAELRENQTDQDSLPPYDMLDGILERLVEKEQPLAEIVAAGFDRAVVARIDHLLNIAEYKRRQAAPGVKVTSRNFGRDRRYPITNRFRDPGQPLPAPDETLISRAGRASAEAFEG